MSIFPEISFFRQNGYSQRNRRNQYKEFARNVHENELKRMYCLNSMKYQIPGSYTEPEVPPYAVEFCTAAGSEYIFSVADEDGNISLFTSERTSKSWPLKPLFRMQAHNNAIFDISWIPREHILTTASGDNTAAIWDMIKGEVVTKLKGHSCTLRTINACKQNSDLLVTGSRDGNVLLWDRRSTQPFLRIHDAHVVNDGSTPKRKRRLASTTPGQLVHDSQQSVSCALFQDCNTVITAGTRDGAIKLWDIRKIKQTRKTSAKKQVEPVETLEYAGNSLRRRGYTCLTLDSTNTLLYASCTDDSIYQYHLMPACPDGKREPTCRYRGHISSSFYIGTALSCDDQFLLSGSCDNKGYIWNAGGKCELPIVSLSSDAMAETTAVAWCPSDIAHLVTCSDDCGVRVWNMPRQEPPNLPLEGYAETVKKDVVLGCKCGCDFSPISAVSRCPVPDSTPTSSNAMQPLFTPVKSLREKTPAFQTPSRKLVQTSVTSLFTPTKSLTTPPPKKATTPRHKIKDTGVTPPSIEKWLVKREVVKVQGHSEPKASRSLDMEMRNSAIEQKENSVVEEKENASSVANSYVTPTKNWLQELGEKRKSNSGGGSASKRKRRSLASPLSADNQNRTPKRNVKSISSYFKDGNLR